MYINYEIIVREVTKPGPVFGEDEFYIRAFQLDHTKPCFGYCLEEYQRPGEFFPAKAKELGIPIGPLWGKLQNGETITLEDGKVIKPEDVLGPARNGRKFSFVTDTLPCANIAAEVRGSDLFVCEGMFEDALADSAHEKKHMTAVEAASIAKKAGVKKLALIHYSPRYSGRELEILEREARAVFSETVLTKDRMVFPLEFED